MSLLYTCPTGGEQYPAEISVNRVIYVKDNQRIDLPNEDDDCVDCKGEVNQEMDRLKEEARQRVRERKQTT